MAEPEVRSDTPTPLEDQQVEQVVGNLLRTGVVISAVVVIVGGVAYLLREGGRPLEDHHVYRKELPQRRRPLSIFQDALSLKSEGLIDLGLLLLILTPIARVVFSVVAFALQRDRTFVLITLLVLAILLYSLFSGHIH
jgi:uncharacterized membrane protein